MHTIYSEKRRSGIPLIGDLSWGSHFCQFYQNEEELADILVPYFAAGLQDNEYCLWIASATEDAQEALARSLPGFDGCRKRGQIEVLPNGRPGQCDGGFSVVSRIDRAIMAGFDGLRLAIEVPRGEDANDLFVSEIADSIGRYNAIAVFSYARNDFDALGLMEVVKAHGSALVRDGGQWEVIESSEARVIRDELKRSEERLRSLFSNMSEGFAYHRIVVDGRGKPCDYVFLEINAAFEKLTGLRAEDVIGRRATQVIPGMEQDPNGLIKRYGRVALTGEPAHFESWAEPFGKWYSVSAFSPHKGYFGVTFSDITERKLIESELVRAKTEWENTFDSVPDLIAILDRDHRVVRVNRAMARRLGKTPEECIGAKCHEVVHMSCEPTAGCPHSLSIQDGLEHILELHEPRLGGDFMVSTTPLTDGNDELIGCVHVARDITERKSAEEALKASEERYRTTVSSIGDAVITTDREGRITFVNPVAESLTGWSYGDAAGRPLAEVFTIVNEQTRERAVNPVETVLRLGRTSELANHTALISRDGREIPIEDSAAPIMNGRGEMLGVVMVFHDVTEKRRAERSLQKARDDLEERVKQRTTELTTAYEALKQETREREQAEAQLRQAQKMDALGTLAGGIAHDFNNMLAAIIGFTEIASGRLPTDAPVQPQLKRVLEAGLRGRELVKQMLTFSRRTEQEKKPLRLCSVVKETSKLLRGSLPSFITIRLNLEDETGLVLGDPVQMQQVLMNLCTNAAFAMRESGGTLDIGLSRVAVSPDRENARLTPGSYMKLTVADNGAGMAPAILDKIFDPFFTTKKPGEGTGLGLSVVHGIVNQHSGTITVESEAGKGSLFAVYLPRIAQGEVEEPSQGETILGGSGRILFVDDEEPLTEMGQELLEGLGYEVVVKTSSMDALEAFKEDGKQFDLVITDQTMPGMTGVELAREILKVSPSTPVILCTGFSHLVDADKAKASGVRAFVMKPLTKREIAETVRRVLTETGKIS